MTRYRAIGRLGFVLLMSFGTGRGGLKAKWQKIWTKYRDRVVWDDKERCFRVS